MTKKRKVRKFVRLDGISTMAGKKVAERWEKKKNVQKREEQRKSRDKSGPMNFLKF